MVVKPRKVLSSFRNLVSPVAVLFSRHADAGARALVSCFCFASVSVCVCVLFRLGFVAGAAVSAASLCLFVFSISRLLSSLSHTFSSLRCNSSSSSTSKLLDCNQSPCVFTPLPPYHLTLPCLASLHHHHHHLPWSSLSVTHLIGLFYVYVYVYSPYHHLFLSVCLFCWRLPHQQGELLHCSISVSSVYPQWYPSSLHTHQSNTHTTREKEKARNLCVSVTFSLTLTRLFPTGSIARVVLFLIDCLTFTFLFASEVFSFTRVIILSHNTTTPLSPTTAREREREREFPFPSAH